MIVVTIVFDKNISDFDNMIRVWKRTARKYMGYADIRVLTVPAPEKIERPCDKYMAYSSSYAFLEMAKWVLEQDDDVIMTDADIMFLGDCKSVFDEEFDMACTVREGRCFVNAGVLFIRNSRKGKELLRRAMQITEKIVANPDRYRLVLKRYLGGDQAAVAVMASKGEIAKLPCYVWNAEQHSWHKYKKGRTKIVHMKSSLWDLAHNEPMRSEYEEGHSIYTIFDIWKSFLKKGEFGEI